MTGKSFVQIMQWSSLAGSTHIWSTKALKTRQLSWWLHRVVAKMCCHMSTSCAACWGAPCGASTKTRPSRFVDFQWRSSERALLEKRSSVPGFATSTAQHEIRTHAVWGFELATFCLVRCLLTISFTQHLWGEEKCFPFEVTQRGPFSTGC
jgi:hypothetical protein